MATKTRTARKQAAAHVLGQSGYRVVNIGDVAVEVNTSHAVAGEEHITSVRFPLPGETTWAVVALATADGSRWSVGIDGWTQVDFPTIHDAVAAAVDPVSRKAIRAYADWFKAEAEMAARLRDLRAAQPALPAGACR